MAKDGGNVIFLSQKIENCLYNFWSTTIETTIQIIDVFLFAMIFKGKNKTIF